MLMPSSSAFYNQENSAEGFRNHYPKYAGTSSVEHGSQYNESLVSGFYGHHPSTINKNNVVLIDTGQNECMPALEYKIIVGYLGTIEMPGQLTGPRLQIVRQCIKKMRQEKRQPVAVLMTILPHCMTLRNANNQVLATYAASRMSYVSNGTQSETERSLTNFGLITTAYYDSSGVMLSPSRDPATIRPDAVVSNSCHVFMVNQKIVDHRVHFEKLSLFKIRCTRDPISNLCLEFPKDTDYVVNLIRSMYTLNVNEEQLNRVARNKVAVAAPDDRNEAAALSNSPQPSNHSEITTASSNSDSGIGFHNDCTNICDRILVVDFPGLRARPNSYDEWRNVVSAASQNPRPLGIATDRDLCPIEGTSASPNAEVENKLTVRAMPFPKIAAKDRNTGYDERPVDVQMPEGIHPVPVSHNINKSNEFIFRPPPVPTTNFKTSAKQRLNFFASKLSPKVFGSSGRQISQSCENISPRTSMIRRPLTEELDKCASETPEDEYIDIWGSVTEVDEQDCQALYSEIEAQRQHFLDGAISEPNIAVSNN